MWSSSTINHHQSCACLSNSSPPSPLLPPTLRSAGTAVSPTAIGTAPAASPGNTIVNATSALRVNTSPPPAAPLALPEKYQAATERRPAPTAPQASKATSENPEHHAQAASLAATRLEAQALETSAYPAPLESIRIATRGVKLHATAAGRESTSLTLERIEPRFARTAPSENTRRRQLRLPAQTVLRGKQRM